MSQLAKSSKAAAAKAQKSALQKRIEAAKSGKFDRVRRLQAKFNLVFCLKFGKIPTGV